MYVDPHGTSEWIIEVLVSIYNLYKITITAIKNSETNTSNVYNVIDAELQSLEDFQKTQSGKDLIGFIYTDW